MYLTTVKKLSAIFDDVAKGTAKRYIIIGKDGKRIAYCYEKELAENIVSANAGARLIEEEVFCYDF